MEAPQEATAAPEKTPAQSPPGKDARRFYRQPAAVIALIAIVLLAWQAYSSRQQVRELEMELAHGLREAESQSKESRGVAEQVREATREVQIKLGVLEAKLQESQNQQIALEALYQELSRSRDESLL